MLGYKAIAVLDPIPPGWFADPSNENLPRDGALIRSGWSQDVYIGEAKASCKPRGLGNGWLIGGLLSTTLIDRKEHKAPGDECWCGFHGEFRLKECQEYEVARAEETEQVLISALVDGRGKIVVHEYGWRSEYMTILALISREENDDLVRRVVASTGLPAIHVSTFPLLLYPDTMEEEILIDLEA